MRTEHLRGLGTTFELLSNTFVVSGGMLASEKQIARIRYLYGHGLPSSCYLMLSHPPKTRCAIRTVDRCEEVQYPLVSRQTILDIKTCSKYITR